MEDKKISKDDEVEILGQDTENSPLPLVRNRKRIISFSILGLIMLIGIIILFFSQNKKKHIPQPRSSQTGQQTKKQTDRKPVLRNGFIEVQEETVNDVPLYVYIPHNTYMELSLGMPDNTDSSVVFVAQAADVRADNYEIVGDYVLAGEQLARGQRKEGFCAVINKKVTVGVSGQTKLLNETILKGGYFFRQYPLVKNSKVVENAPRGKSIRRALAVRKGEIIMVESRSRESFHDFSQALVDIEISDAIYLVGEYAFGWYYDKEGLMNTFGKEKENLPNTNYLVWKTQ